MASERVVYRERTPWAMWVYLVLWGAFAAAGLPLLWGETAVPLPGGLLLAASVLLVAALVQVLFGGTTVLVETEAIRVHLGLVPVLSKRVRYADIRALESVRYRPIREFGGWGIRGFGQKQAWTARGDQAVVLHLVSGRDLYIGSDHPHRLEDRIRMAAGGHLASSAR